MIGPRAFAVLAATLWTAQASAPAAGPPAIESRYTRLRNCRELEHGNVDKGEDWLRQRCQGYGAVSIWLRYADSARVYVGFGTKPNETGDMFSVERDDAWPVEWRGVQVNGSFEPFAAILRMRVPAAAGGTTPKLIVFRLRPDGTSCTVGSTRASNQTARRIADAARLQFVCESEPWSL